MTEGKCLLNPAFKDIIACVMTSFDINVCILALKNDFLCRKHVSLNRFSLNIKVLLFDINIKMNVKQLHMLI